MTETEIIKLVFGLFLGVGGGVLLLLAFTVGYRYLVMEQRCTCRTNGTVIGYSAVSYGERAVPCICRWCAIRQRGGNTG